MRRSQRAWTAALVVAAAGAVIAWNTVAQEGPTMIGVSEAKRTASDYDGRILQVRGFVDAASIQYNGTLVEGFALVDEGERLWVVFGQVAPDAFGPKDVVVEGTIGQQPDGTIVLWAQSVHVGCASKY